MDKHYFLNEFPAQKEKIQELKTSSVHFKKLYDSYNTVNHEVERIEAGVEPSSDLALNDLKLKRVVLKDELFAIMQNG